MTLKWSLVSRHIRPHLQLQAKFLQKIQKLEKHLEHFPPDAVHLQVHLSKHPRKEMFTASLTLRLPSNVLRAEKSGADPVPAFDLAVKALLREVTVLKAALRRENQYYQVPRRLAAQLSRPVHFAEARPSI